MNNAKTSAIIALLALSGFLLYGRYQQKKEIAQLQAQQAEPGSETCNPCTVLNGAPFRLEIKTVNDMAKAYAKSSLMPKGPIPKSKGGFQNDDATSAWFDLDALRQFIQEIQKDTCGKTCADKPLKLGVRIYYARYPTLDSLDKNNGLVYPDLKDVEKDFENLHTVFMVPTYDEGSRHKDFDPMYWDEKNKCIPLTINPDTWNAGNKILVLTDFSAKNHGSLCPPLCGGGAFEVFRY